MSSLEQNLKQLKTDLMGEPMRINAYHDLPFAIFRYHPTSEYQLRKQARLLAITLNRDHHKNVTFVSLAQMMWKAIKLEDGLEKIAQLEQRRGFAVTETTVHTYLEGETESSLVHQLLEKFYSLDPVKDIVFLVRAAAMAPSIYRCSHLLDQLHGNTMVPIVLFYPGTADGPTNLRFMNIPDQSAHGGYNYRVKIYGGEV